MAEMNLCLCCDRLIANARDAITQSQYWSHLRSATDKIKKIAIGCLTAAILMPICEFMERRIFILLNMPNMSVQQAQEVILIWNKFSSLPKVISIGLKTAFLGYIVILAPIFEEWLFRHKLDQLLRRVFGDSTSTANKVMRVVANGFIFGAAHLSPAQGWANLPIFCSCFFAGCCLSALKEVYGDTIASTSAHILNNAVVSLIFFAM